MSVRNAGTLSDVWALALEGRDHCLLNLEEVCNLHLHAAILEFEYEDQHWLIRKEPPETWDESLFTGWNLWNKINQIQT